ncbi:hypothetical protein GCM10020331_031590 [Ectobacillus funiculus]
MDDLLNGYEEMSRQGYMLEHLEIPRELQELREELQKCTIDLQKCGNCESTGAYRLFLKEKLDTLYDQLEVEATSKHYVDKESYILHDMLGGICAKRQQRRRKKPNS